MKTLLASTAIALATAGSAMAEQHTMSNDMGNEPFVGGIETEALRASDLLGARLYVSEAEVDDGMGLSDDWDDVGEISDIILGNNGEIDAVIADIGGFLGIGERTVAVNMDDLQFVSDGEDADDYFVVLSGVTQDVLENAPEFNDDFTTGRTAAVMETDVQGTGMDTSDSATIIVNGEEQTDLADGTTVDAEQTPATATVTDEGVETEMEGEMAEAEADMEQAGDAMENAAEDAGQEMEEMGNDVEVMAEDAEAEVDQEMNEAEAEMTKTTTVEGSAFNTAPSMEMDGYETVVSTDLTTEDVTGAPVYGINDDRIGEIGELVMSEDGMLDEAIIDVGGFLGLGEKPVAVPFDNLQILRSDNDVRIYIDATQEQLEGLPDYEG